MRAQLSGAGAGVTQPACTERQCVGLARLGTTPSNISNLLMCTNSFASGT
jgi:hypothetical protein